MKLCRSSSKEEDSEVASLAHYVCEYGGFPAYENTGVKYFSCGEDKIEELIRQLEKAEKFIFMEYFIVAKGYVWDRVLEVLKRKAAEGVEVRFMYDGTCTVSLLPPNYPKNSNRKGLPAVCFHRSGRLCPTSEQPRSPKNRGDRRQSGIYRRHQHGG